MVKMINKRMKLDKLFEKFLSSLKEMNESAESESMRRSRSDRKIVPSRPNSEILVSLSSDKIVILGRRRFAEPTYLR